MTDSHYRGTTKKNSWVNNFNYQHPQKRSIHQYSENSVNLRNIYPRERQKKRKKKPSNPDNKEIHKSVLNWKA